MLYPFNFPHIKRISQNAIKIKKISPWILNIIRMGIYQIIFLDKDGVLNFKENVKAYDHEYGFSFITDTSENVKKEKSKADFVSAFVFLYVFDRLAFDCGLF